MSIHLTRISYIHHKVVSCLRRYCKSISALTVRTYTYLITYIIKFEKKTSKCRNLALVLVCFFFRVREFQKCSMFFNIKNNNNRCIKKKFIYEWNSKYVLQILKSKKCALTWLWRDVNVLGLSYIFRRTSVNFARGVTTN